MITRVSTPSLFFRSISRSLKAIGLGGLFLISIHPSIASDVHSARTAGLGGAGHASPLLNDAVFLNPAFASFLKSYSAAIQYLKFSGGDEHFGRNYSVSVQDGRSKLFQAGLAYSVTEEGAWLHVGASHSFIQRTGFGLGGKFFFGNESRSEEIRDMIFSTSWATTNWFQMSLIVDNLVQSEDSKSLNRYREIILGTKIGLMGLVFAYVDPHYAPSVPTANEKLGWEIGLEFAAFGDLFLRTGYFKNALVPFQNARARRGFSAGAGWIGGRISIDYALKRVLEPGNNLPSATAHVFGFTAFF